MAALLRNGHSRVFEYGYSFVNVCAEELAKHEKDLVFNTAVSVRTAGIPNDDWKKFMDEHIQKNKKAEPVKQKKKQMTIEEHRAVARRLRGL